jgi:Sel1 repeat
VAIDDYMGGSPIPDSKETTTVTGAKFMSRPGCMIGWWAAWGLTTIIAVLGPSEAPAASFGGANCDGALMVVEIAAAVERGAEPPADESFQQLMGSARFIAAAEAGDAVAEYMLSGRLGDQTEALEWTRRAAEHGHERAQADLGLRYMLGQEVPQSYFEAFKWYSRAAQQGLVGVFATLGAMYERGQGVPQDFVEAYKWYTLAAARMQARAAGIAAEDRDKLAAKMTPGQVAEAQARALDWKAVTEPSPCVEVFKRALRERLQR